MSKISLPLPALYLLIYFIGRYPVNSWLQNDIPNYSYYFEIMFICASLYTYRKKLFFEPLVKETKLIIIAVSYLIAGFLTADIIQEFDIIIPFQITALDLFLIVLFGPVLEELLFRQSLWILFDELLKSKIWTAIVTSVLFSLSHFVAYFYAPETYYSFIIIQSLYTLALGGACAYMMLTHRSVWAAMAIHILFNLGFVVGM